MARLQILQLPAEHHGDDTVTPFVLIIDQAGEETIDTLSAPEAGGSPYETAIARLASLTLAEQIGARAVLAFRETVDIPASEAGAHTEPLLRVGDFTDPDEARQWARHGYEIGQRHCDWTDHGVAPAWLTEGWPPHFDSCEHLKRAAELDETIARVRAVSTTPEVMNADQERADIWLHGYEIGVLAAKSALRPRNEPTVKP